MKHILLIGNDGQVGGELQRILAPLGALTTACYPAIDLAKPASIRQVVREHRPDLIVNAAAYTAVDKAESEPALCRKVNAMGPAVLAEEARRLKAGLIHYSTDFVFDGTQRSPYKETDVPLPLSVYGKTKHEGDLAIETSGVPHLIFRLAWVYGLSGKNFLLTIQRLAKEGKPLRIVNDQVGCPTWSRTVAETTAAVLTMLDKPDAPFSMKEASGIYHAVCAGETSWFGFARAFISPEIPIDAIPTTDYPTPARRPAYSVLDCSKLQRTFGLTMPRWDESLQVCLKAG